jgi:hypothetical protein
MVMNNYIKNKICELFEVYDDEAGVQRVVTPLEYPGTNDFIVVRIRSLEGNKYLIDENGEAAFNAGLSGGDVESEAIERWANHLPTLSPVQYTEGETLSVIANDESLIAPYIFRVAEAAQQLHTIATAQISRHASDFKERIKKIIQDLAIEENIDFQSDVDLPIAGGLKADHVIGATKPLIIITATSVTRLLEAEIIYMQYRQEKKAGYVLVVAESQESVGKKQFERASYFTNKTVIFNPEAFGSLIATELNA